VAPKILPGSVCYLENHSSRPAFYLVYAVELGNVYEVVRRRGRLGSSGQWPPARAIVRTAAVARNECLRLVAARQRSGYQASGLPPQIVASLR
jgi:predicted DNA-binding WGR domain protein